MSIITREKSTAKYIERLEQELIEIRIKKSSVSSENSYLVLSWYKYQR